MSSIFLNTVFNVEQFSELNSIPVWNVTTFTSFKYSTMEHLQGDKQRVWWCESSLMVDCNWTWSLLYHLPDGCSAHGSYWWVWPGMHPTYRSPASSPPRCIFPSNQWRPDNLELPQTSLCKEQLPQHLHWHTQMFSELPSIIRNSMLFLCVLSALKHAYMIKKGFKHDKALYQ